MKINKFILAFSLISTTAFADTDLDYNGFYVGGGIGYGIQNLSFNNSNSSSGSPSIRLMAGYEFASWIDGELGYTYISQSSNFNNLGIPSTTIYDLSFTPGITLPSYPVTLFVRLGINGVSNNLNSAFYNQIFSPLHAGFEYGLGVKVNIPGYTFIRAEYINIGTYPNNDNSNINVHPSIFMIDAGYVF